MSVMRVHSTIAFDATGHGDGTPVIPHFPWLYGDEAAVAMRAALEMRYRLIPMLYSLGHEAYEQGVPIMRPLLMEFGVGHEHITDQWLVGRGMMAAPVMSAGGSREVFLPALAGKAERWFRFNTSQAFDSSASSTVQVHVELDESPVYCRSGAIVPLGPVVQHTGELPGKRVEGFGQLEVQIYAGADGSFALKEDDGATTAYETGAVRATTFHWNDEAQALTWEVDGSATDQSMFEDMTARLFSAEDGVKVSPVLKLGAAGTYKFGEVSIVV